MSDPISNDKAAEANGNLSTEIDVYGKAVPILPVRQLVAFPLMTVPFMVTLPSSPPIDEAMKTDRIVGLLTVKATDAPEPVPGQLYEIGTIARIVDVKKNDDGVMVVLMEGINRFKVSVWEPEGDYLKARVIKAPEIVESDLETEVLNRQLQKSVKALMTAAPNVPESLIQAIARIEDPLKLAYVSAFNLNLDTETRQSLLEIDSVNEKLRRLLTHSAREQEKLVIDKKIQSEVRQKMSKSQKDYFLRQQLNEIKKELGEDEEKPSEIDEYARRLAESEMTEEALDEASRELDRMKHMSPQSAEYPIIKTYLDWLFDLPWTRASEDNDDISSARRVLDEDHYGLEDVKERLIEFLAVRSLTRAREGSSHDGDTQDKGGVILCLTGPPGVGKTSLGRSVARALGRKFSRMSLGGIRDEAEIRGHRRTYVGAMPGRIIQAVKRAGTKNPVFMLDEIDKIGRDWRGDPSSALLEVLDPAQNATFRDHYLDVDFDLSDVVFIATANQLDTVPGPLRDRMEIIQLEGYTVLEKLQIAKRHLIPRQLRAHRLREDEITFMDDAVRKITEDYTREAGVRNLERHIAAVCRKSIVQLSEKGWPHVVITAKLVREYLKKERFASEKLEAFSMPGIATGLAVTPVGGEILFVEASRMPGKGRLTLTGQLGDVMRESAEIAHSYVRSMSGAFGIDPSAFEGVDVHLHVPAGALPKDGPSAGVAMVMALASLFTGKRVRDDVGITGEITLRGRVLPVGGIKMKVLAAHRAGLKTVILPERNRRDLDELPGDVTGGMHFVTADRVEDVLVEAFDDNSTYDWKEKGVVISEEINSTGGDNNTFPLAYN